LRCRCTRLLWRASFDRPTTLKNSLARVLGATLTHLTSRPLEPTPEPKSIHPDEIKARYRPRVRRRLDLSEGCASVAEESAPLPDTAADDPSLWPAGPAAS
jgi:hypothetical protein